MNFSFAYEWASIARKLMANRSIKYVQHCISKHLIQYYILVAAFGRAQSEFSEIVAKQQMKRFECEMQVVDNANASKMRSQVENNRFSDQQHRDGD